MFLTTKSKLNSVAKKIHAYDEINLSDNKICVCFLNTYEREGSLKLGTPPLNDGILMCENLSKYFNYKCYYIHDGNANMFKDIFANIIKQIDKDIVIYYSGHGTQVQDLNGDEPDGRDEALCFVKRSIDLCVDDEIANIIRENNKCKKLILIADCCHSGSVWDLKDVDDSIKKNITAISSCKDEQVSAQLLMNGLFTSMFWEYYDKTNNCIQLSKLHSSLFSQDVVAVGDKKDGVLRVNF